MRVNKYPTKPWDEVPVFGVWQGSDETPELGTIDLTLSQRVTRTDGRVIFPDGAKRSIVIGDPSQQDPKARAAVRLAWKAADRIATGAEWDEEAWDIWWETTILPAAIFVLFPACDDLDITPQGWQVKVEEKLRSRSGKEYYIDTPLSVMSNPIPGVNLGLVDASAAMDPSPVYTKGQPGGIASLDSTGHVPQEQIPGTRTVSVGVIPAVFDLAEATSGRVIQGSVTGNVTITPPAAAPIGTRIDLVLSHSSSCRVAVTGARSRLGMPIVLEGAGVTRAHLLFTDSGWLAASDGKYDPSAVLLDSPSIVSIPAGGSVIVYGVKSSSSDREQLLHLDTSGETIEAFRTGTFVNASGQVRVFEDLPESLAGYGFVGSTARNVGIGRLVNGEQFRWAGKIAAAVYPRRLSRVEQAAAIANLTAMST